MDLFTRIFRVVRAHTSATEPSDTYEYWRPPEPTPVPAEDPVLSGYYANLELPYGANLEEVKTAWKRLMKQYHPDRHAQDPAKREVANALCAQLTHAYKELEKSLTTH